jgi:predicted methyltransferase
MLRHRVISSFVLCLAACGESSPPPAVAPVAPPAASPPVATATPPLTSPEPTPEQKKKAEEQRLLENDRAAWEKKRAAESAQWTPERRAKAKQLAETTFPSGKAAIAAALAGPHRIAGNAERDKHRHPVETLELFGFKPTMSVLDVGPGEGWYTELLAPALAKKGKYAATSNDPNGPEEARPTFYGRRWKSFLEIAPEIYGKVETVVVDGKSPKLAENAYDMVLLMRGVHGMVNNKTWDVWLDEFHKALKPGGVLGIEEHRANADADVATSSKKGYVPEKFVIETAKKHGFELAAKSEVNANPKDTKDHPEGVWTLPPTLRLGEKDKDKYLAIGESDRMTLKLVKVAPKK